MKALHKLAVLFVSVLLLAIFPAFARVEWNQTRAPINGWVSIASSADGEKLIAVSPLDWSDSGGSIYMSTNGGQTWVQTVSATSHLWESVASSSDGTKLVRASDMGPIYTSTDSGITWNSNNIPRISWDAIASSSDGMKLAVAGETGTNGGVVYTTTNAGMNWTSNSLPVTPLWGSIAGSADGNKLAVVSPYGPICISTNGGTTWQQASNLPGLIWAHITSSADGTKLFAISQKQSPANGGSIYSSFDSGQTWMSNNVPNIVWWTIAASADGLKLVATGGQTNIFYSTDAGTTWHLGALSPNASTFQTIISSADGNRLAAIYGGSSDGTLNASSSYIYNLYFTPSPSLNLTASSTNIALSWTIPATNFVLQQSTSLTSPSWSVVTNTPTLNLTNLQNQVWLAPTGNAAFYRLTTP